MLETPSESPTTLQYDPGSRHLWVTPSTLQGYCFKPFEPIESLTLDSISFAFFDANPPQESLRNLISSVRNLHILSPDARPGAILRFLSTFPSLQDVTIHAPRWTSDSGLDEVDEIGNVRISCSTLRISELDDQSNPFLSLLGSVSGAYEKVAVVKCNLLDVGPLQTLISQAGKTIRRLQIVIPSHCKLGLSPPRTCIFNTRHSSKRSSYFAECLRSTGTIFCYRCRNGRFIPTGQIRNFLHHFTSLSEIHS